MIAEGHAVLDLAAPDPRQRQLAGMRHVVALKDLDQRVAPGFAAEPFQGRRRLRRLVAQRLHQAEDAVAALGGAEEDRHDRSEEHTSELQSLMRTSYAVFCLKKK